MEYIKSWSDDLQCNWISWKVIGLKKIHLELPDDNCCDMVGCIRTAKKIMPDVDSIMVTCGEKMDTCYAIQNGKWIALKGLPLNAPNCP